MNDIDPPFVHGEAGERAAQIINVELGKGLAVIAVVTALAALGLGLSVHAIYVSQQARMEQRLDRADIDAIKIQLKAQELNRANP